MNDTKLFYNELKTKRESQNLTLEEISDFILGVPAEETARIQELHILVGHLMCAVIDEVF